MRYRMVLIAPAAIILAALARSEEEMQPRERSNLNINIVPVKRNFATHGGASFVISEVAINAALFS